MFSRPSRPQRLHSLLWELENEDEDGHGEGVGGQDDDEDGHDGHLLEKGIH